MARHRHKNFTPNSFETRDNKTLSATIFAEMMTSEAYYKLTNNQKVLYLYMKLQYYGQKDKPNGQADCFYFNKAMYVHTYRLYDGWKQFDRDRAALIRYGFIEEVENGKCTRTKSIYRFSDKWKAI